MTLVPEDTVRQRVKAVDPEHEDYVLTSVNRHSTGYSFSMNDGLSFGISDKDNKNKVVPKVGSAVRVYGRGFGSPIRGVDIDGQEVYYRTPREQDLLHEKWVADEKAKRLREFKKTGKKKQDAIYKKLPKVFKQRIDRFRAGNPEFRIEHEGYELFCCTEALKIARTLKTKEAVLDFQKMGYEEQKRAVKVSGGHSGNTFGMAVRLAYWYIEKQENVAKEHGALVPIVGCKEYGCTHEA